MTIFNRRRAFELAEKVVQLASTPTDDDGRAVAVVVMMPGSLAIPVVSLAMDGAMLASVKHAESKCATVLAYNRNTADLAAHFTDADAANARGSCPYFTTWDGGIRVYDGLGGLVCALGVDGRTHKGSRILAVMAAYELGYKTDFGTDGLTDKERSIPKRLPGDL